LRAGVRSDRFARTVVGSTEEPKRMPLVSFFAVGIGAFFGALLRWGFGILWNTVIPNLPLGTLAANLVGGFIIGGALGAFEQFQDLPPELRLFITTGFCGGLTTFSSFSAEAVVLFTRQQYGWFTMIIASHVVGSLMMTFAGMALVRYLVKA
jgi:fluoride exporter